MRHRNAHVHQRVHRPIADSGAHVWISYSPDLRSWGGHRMMLQVRRGGWWDANKVGLSPPLIETARGWLMLYHGVRSNAAGSLYRLGVALFDVENPAELLLRSDEWIFGPEETYETHGDVNNVTFPCGSTVGADGDTSIFTTARRIPASPWPREASARFSIGSTDTGGFHDQTSRSNDSGKSPAQR